MTKRTKLMLGIDVGGLIVVTILMVMRVMNGTLFILLWTALLFNLIYLYFVKPEAMGIKDPGNPDVLLYQLFIGINILLLIGSLCGIPVMWLSWGTSDSYSSYDYQRDVVILGVSFVTLACVILASWLLHRSKNKLAEPIAFLPLIVLSGIFTVWVISLMM